MKKTKTIKSAEKIGNYYALLIAIGAASNFNCPFFLTDHNRMDKSNGLRVKQSNTLSGFLINFQSVLNLNEFKRSANKLDTALAGLLFV